MISVAKLIGTPGSWGFLVLCCAAGGGIACIGPRSRRFAKWWLLAVSTVYMVGALPVTGEALTKRLPPYEQTWTPGEPNESHESDILVVLSGDNPQGRAQEARRIFYSVAPRCVLVSGEPWFVHEVVAAGVARERVVVDDTATTTREQVEKLSAWAEQCGARRVVLIASTVSMPRIAALVTTAGVPVVLAPSAIDDAPASLGVRRAIPSFQALRVSRDALYEHLALVYYRQRKWIR